MRAPCLARPGAGRMALTTETPLRPMPLSRAPACGAAAHRCIASCAHLFSTERWIAVAVKDLRSVEARLLLAAQHVAGSLIATASEPKRASVRFVALCCLG